MNFIMTPPAQDNVPIYSEVPSVSSMRMISGLGQVPSTQEDSGFWSMSVGTVAISALVISALAFMALCVVMASKR